MKLIKIAIIDDDLISNYITKYQFKTFNKFMLDIKEYTKVDTLLDSISLDNIPDIFIIDINLPIMNGFKLIKTIKEKYDTSNTLFAILSSSNHDKDLLKSKELGVKHYCKPITDENIKEIFENFEEIIYER